MFDNPARHATTQRSIAHPGIADPEEFTARELYEQCRTIGSLALKSRRQFIGLLPLVERRQAYRGRGLYSTYDFAAKLGGINRDIVTEVLRLDQQLKDFSRVRKLLYSGRVGWSKIRMVAAWLTVENQEEWIEKLENISNQALALYLRDVTAQQYRRSQGSIVDIEGVSIQNSQSFGQPFSQSSDQPSGQSSDQLLGQLTWRNSVSQSSNFEKSGKNEAESFGAEISEYNRGYFNSQEPPSTKFDQLAYERETFTFSLNRQIAAKMRLFRQKLEKDRKELITWEEVMVEFLSHIEENQNGNTGHDTEKKEPSSTREPSGIQVPAGAQIPPGTQEPPDTQIPGKTNVPAPRHIPAAVRRAVLRQYDGLCAFNNCSAPAEIFHHTRRFSLTNRLPKAEAHDPNFIKPLCKPHERIVHNTLIEDEEVNPANWKLLISPDRYSLKYAVDQVVIGYRKPK